MSKRKTLRKIFGEVKTTDDELGSRTNIKVMDVYKTAEILYDEWFEQDEECENAEGIA